MTAIKLVVSDVDGTLVSAQQNEVSEVVREAIIAAEKKKVRVIPVTGRPYAMVEPVLRALGCDSYCVVDNGATIRNAVTGEIVWSNWLDLERVRQLVRILLPYSPSIDYSPDWDEHVPDKINELQLVNQAAPCVFTWILRDELDVVNAALQAVPNISSLWDAHSTDPRYVAGAITDSSATKFHGVEEVRQLLECTKAETMAIGDGNNDLPLFQNAGLKIAMGNATDLLKAEADHVVGTLAEHGFAQAISGFVLT